MVIDQQIAADAENIGAIVQRRVKRSSRRFREGSSEDLLEEVGALIWVRYAGDSDKTALDPETRPEDVFDNV
jgi:hypothetical protein